MFNNELSYRVVGQGSCFRLWCLVQCFKLRAHSILRLATVSELNEMGRAQTIVVCRVVESWDRILNEYEPKKLYSAVGAEVVIIVSFLDWPFVPT